MRPGELVLDDRPRDGSHTLALTGELDLATAPDLEAVILSLCSDGACEIVLDLSQVSFLDSSGLRAILSSKTVCEEHHLRAHELLARGRQVEPRRAIDLGVGAHASRAARPFQLEGVAADRARVEVALERPRAHELSARLPDLADVDRRTLRRRSSELLGELAPRRGERVLAGLVFALRQRPGARVPVAPERTAHVREQDLHRLAAPSVEEQTSAQARHGRSVSAPRVGAAGRDFGDL